MRQHFHLNTPEMVYSLRPLQPELAPGGTFCVPRETRVFRVGRDQDSDLIVDHSSVSGLHAQLTLDHDAQLEVVDCGSSNGTFVNGTRVERHRLVDGDLLRFAAAEFRVEETPSSQGESSLSIGSEIDLLPKTDQSPPLISSDDSTDMELEKNLEEDLHREIDERDAEILQLKEQIAEQRKEIRSLERGLSDATDRDKRMQSTLSETRRELMTRHGEIAALHYEITTKDGSLQQLKAEKAKLQQVGDDYKVALSDLKGQLEQAQSEYALEATARAEAEAYARQQIEHAQALGETLRQDWSAWISPERIPAAGSDDSNAIFESLSIATQEIRSELDKIEPIWHTYGAGVQDELAQRCKVLREETRKLEEEISVRRADLAQVKDDLNSFRELMDQEVRRAQGLSRSGIQIEIPARFERMVIARDREQELLRILIEHLDILDRRINTYRKTWRSKEYFNELTEVRSRLVATLKANGVQSYEIPPGTQLSLPMRREVQVMNRKGWGTKQYVEIPFRPGEVSKVIRPGYRIGEGDEAIILRKVEVLIRGGEE